MALTHPIYIWRGPDNQKLLMFPESSPVVLATSFLDWDIAVPRAPLPPPAAGLGPGWRALPHWKALRFFGMAIQPDFSVPALGNLDVFTLAFTADFWERLFAAISRDGRLFIAPIPSALACLAMVDSATKRLPAPAPGLPSPLSLTFADIDQSAESFMLPAPFGAGAIPGPTALQFIADLPLRGLLSPFPRQMAHMAQLAAMLGAMHTRAGRGAGAQVRGDSAVGIEFINSALASSSGNRVLSDVFKSAKLPELLHRTSADFPHSLERNCVTSIEFARDFETRVAFIYGRTEDRQRIERERIFGFVRTHPTFGKLISLAGNLNAVSSSYMAPAVASEAAAYAGAYSVVALCLPRRTRELLSDLASALEIELDRSSLRLLDLFNKGEPFHKVMEELRTHRVRLGSAESSSAGGAPDGASDPAAGLRLAGSDHRLQNITRDALQRALNSPAFEKAYRDVQALGGLDAQDSKLRALGIVFSAGSRLLTRFLRYREARLEATHELFSMVKPLLYLDMFYLGQAAAIFQSNPVPKLARNFAWGEAEQIERDEASRSAQDSGKAVRFGSSAKSNKELFFEGKYPRINYVDAPGGFLELARLLDNADAAEKIPRAEHFCNVRTLEGIQMFWSPLFTAKGYAKESLVGDTWWTHCQVYIKFVREGENLIGAELTSHKELSSECFLADLRLLEQLDAERIGTPDPGGLGLDYVLPFVTPAKEKLRERSSTNLQFAEFRRAAGFGSSKRTFTLAGLASTARSSRIVGSPYPSRSASRSPSPSSRSAAGSTGSKKSSVSSAGSNASADGTQLPGSKSYLVKYNGSCTHFTIGDTTKAHDRCSAKGMAEDCKVDINDHCWECMPGISVKSGDAVFSLCTQWGKPGHESKQSSAHVPPSGWDGARMRRRHVVRVDPSAVRGGKSSSRQDGSRRDDKSKSKKSGDKSDSKSSRQSKDRRAPRQPTRV